jgi:hypothetical protein
MRRCFTRALVWLVIPIAVLGGCATKKDTRYRAGTLRPPLTIPAGLDTPAYTQTMEIPAAAPGAKPVEPGVDIELPPPMVRGPEEK